MGTRESSHWTLQAGPGLHMPLHNHPLRFINHSCDPNVLLKEDLRFEARCTIAENEELTIDYNCAEEEIAFGTFSCSCGAKNCVGEVRGWRHLTPEQRAERHHRAGPW